MLFMGVSFGKYLSVLLLVCVLTDSATPVSLATSSSICRRDLNYFVLDLNFQCPFSYPSASSPINVDGESFGKDVSSCTKNEYIAVLFYASGCPFSTFFIAKFSILSYLYPQIKHLMVEQSSAMPSVFSIYGVHSVPSLLIVNQTMKSRYHGWKDLEPLMNFYKRNTGIDPIVYMIEEASSVNSETSQNLWAGASLKEILLREPYMFLSVVFVTLRAVMFFFPESATRLLALWSAYIPCLNLAILRESRQLLGHLLHLIDVGRTWRKVKLLKTRNFQKGARNARVWASSLTSISLGETSQTRGFPSKAL